VLRRERGIDASSENLGGPMGSTLSCLSGPDIGDEDENSLRGLTKQALGFVCKVMCKARITEYYQYIVPEASSSPGIVVTEVMNQPPSATAGDAGILHGIYFSSGTER